MPDIKIKCPVPECQYETPEVPEAVACALLAAHATVHSHSPVPPRVAPEVRGPKLDRPRIDIGVTSEDWNIFTRRWDAFVLGSGLDPGVISVQLFQCASDDLGNGLLKADPAIVSQPPADVMAAMKALAVIPVSVGVIRAELVTMKQERDEPYRSFAARVRGKAETCAYVTKCTCTRSVDYTDAIIRDVLLAGVADLDIRRDILATDNILDRTVNDIVALVESKEMARNAMPSSAAGISSFKRGKAAPAAPAPTTHHVQNAPCPDCKKTYALFSQGASGWNTRPHRQCIDCYRAKRKKRGSKPKAKDQSPEVAAALAQMSSLSVQTVSRHHARHHRRRPIHMNTNCDVPNLDRAHHIFTKGQWRRSRFLKHPEVRLSVSVNAQDYRAFRRRCPNVKPSTITAMTDTGAQSCLWSLKEYLAAGFTKGDLIPIPLDLVAANRSPIVILGAILLRLQGQSPSGEALSCASMVYISEAARGFYLSQEAMMDLGIIPLDFPSVGAATNPPTAPVAPPHTTGIKQAPPRQSEAIPERCPIVNAGCSTPPSTQGGPCSCPSRTVVPDRPNMLPFECTPANNAKMEDWLLHYFASSTFNTCPHRPLPCMTGPPVEIHLKDGVTPKSVHTPASLPLHWQDQVHADLLRDEELGVIEKVPYGEPVTWCHRMVVTRKHNGTPRRTVDLSPLNRHCKRETFASESPFQLARRIPKGTWKTVCDAWNGYHSVPLRESDRHLTTFITPFGRWRYTRAPQGFLSSGDGYNRRFDAILSDFPRKERCVDDTIHFDEDLQAHWWRTIDFLIRVGQSGIVLNPDKFCFARKSVDFAGFRISDTSIEPLPKYLDAIREFPTPTSVTDIRSWFGLVNQVANYAQLRDIMAPFKPFLSPKHHFQWTPALDAAFCSSKTAIVDAICRGVEIFDPRKRTCLRPDWSRLGIGYFLSQKHCSCASALPDCCADGWKITLAGSRFLSPAESRYAPIEGEALAVAWGLEQTKYFTQGCDNLLVITDHKPLVKILGDRTLDEISNTRIFRLKQRTLPWSFEIAHLPGRTNFAADATSRHPSPTNEFVELANIGFCSPPDVAECAMTSAIRRDTRAVTALSWDRIATETSADPTMSSLVHSIEEGFPDAHRAANNDVAIFWPYRESLWISDGVIMYNDRAVIPPSLRGDVLQNLHSAHQGVSAMDSRARAIIFWPGLSDAIKSTRANCSACNRNAPSQAAVPPLTSPVPSTPFESVFADFFTFGGINYLTVGDRLSGWAEIFRAPSGTAYAGALGLIATLRLLFATFGVPEELSSDGGPEFSASATADFLTRWGVHHRISSAYFPQSNGRAEVAVKKAKRLLMSNVGPTGSLDNDGLLRALLQVRNTPDPDCNVSPAEVVFGRPLRDAFSFVNRHVKFDNPSVRPVWREAWATKEEAMRTRFARSFEALDKHARPLAPLSRGDRVFIQNQHGHHPTKWDRSGTVTELGQNDQYWVKVDGSGRVTLRNRRFLRKFVPPTLTVGEPLLPPGSTYSPPVSPIVPQIPLSQSAPSSATCALPTDVPRGAGTTGLTPRTPLKPLPSTLPGKPSVIPTSDSLPPVTMDPQPAGPATSTDATVPLGKDPIPLMAIDPETHTRPRRQMVPRRHYVPETGEWLTR